VIRERRFSRAQWAARESGAEEPGAYTITGHAAVFNEPCDFGYFTERIAPGAFAKALEAEPLEVVSNWQHDDRWALGHTLNQTLDLEEDDIGLWQWTRVAPTTYASDLRILIERGDIQQASFCFTIAREEWAYVEDDEDDPDDIKVTITEIGTLYDVTVCALGAYPQTDVEISARDRFTRALHAGRVRGLDLEHARRRGLVPGVGHPSRAHARAARAFIERERRRHRVVLPPGTRATIPEAQPLVTALSDPRLRAGSHR
jgi:Escherichia/Staphylococcus phage prohead protease